MPSPILKLNKLFNVYNTTIRMLLDRGCTIVGPQPIVDAVAANPSSNTPVSLALLKKLSRPDAEDAQHSGLLINRHALTITCTLSEYVLQLTGTTETNKKAPIMQVAFVAEESTNLSMNTVHQCRDAARKAGAQWLSLVADAKVTPAIRKECDELNIGWTLLTSNVSAESEKKVGSASNAIVTDIVERGGLEIPAGAKPRRSKKSTAAATEASAAAIQNAFVDENLPLAAVVSSTGGADDDDNDNAKNKKSAAVKPRPLFVEIFEEDDLVFSPLRHSLAPKHRVLSESETEALLREKGATLSQLPRMEFIDPIARYFGLQRGAVVHITRAAHTDVVGEHSMYRHIV